MRLELHFQYFVSVPDCWQLIIYLYVKAWTDAISAYFSRMEEPAISLKSLQQALESPWIEVWLGLLLGGYGLERRGDDFYSGNIWVYDRVSVRKEPNC
jgi:hypothetical protein